MRLGHRLQTGRSRCYQASQLLLFTTIVISVVTLSPLRARSAPEFDNAGNQSLVMLVWGILTGASLLLILLRPRGAWRVLRGNPWMTLCWCFAILSTSWTPDPHGAFVRAAYLSAYLVAVLASLTWLPTELEMLGPIRWGTLACILVSIPLAIFLPAYATSSLQEWKGVTSHKNILAHVAALSWALWATHLRPPWTRATIGCFAIVTGTCLACVVFSRSVTGLAMFVAGVLFWLVFRMKDMIGSRGKSLISGLMASGAALAIMFCLVLIQRRFDIVDLLNAVGRDETLTGRTEIWTQVGWSLREHFPVGMGYGGFWLTGTDQGQPVTLAGGWTPTQGHCGYLDLVNELGLVGSTLFLAAFVSPMRESMRRSVSGDPSARAAFMVLVLTLFMNVVESTFLHPGNTWWVVTSAILYSAIPRVQRGMT